MIEQDEFNGLPDNNAARGATTKAIKNIGGGRMCFHTFYTIGTGHDQTSRAVADGVVLPSDADNIKSYEEGEMVDSVFKGNKGKLAKAVHSHDSDVSSFAGGIPIKFVDVE